MKARDQKSRKFIMTEKFSKGCLVCHKIFTPKPSHFERRKTCSRHCAGLLNARYGENNQEWKGDNVGYGAKHDWIRRHHGSPKECEECGITDKERRTINGRSYIQWANVSGKYLRNRLDFIALCARCHILFDRIDQKVS